MDNVVTDGTGIDLSKLDVEDQISTIRGQFLNVNVWLVETQDDLDKMFLYIEKFDVIAWDTETNNPQKHHFPSVYLHSLAVKINEAFVIPYKFNKQMTDWLVTTEKLIVMHNAGYDMKIIHHETGKFIKNFGDTLLLKYCMVNDAVNTPRLSLKEQAKKMYGSWAEDVTDLDETCVNDIKLQYYSGVDPMATLWLYNQHKTDLDATPQVDLFDIFPSDHPSLRSYTREWFYKNVATQLLPITIEFMNTGIHFDVDRLHALDVELEDELARIDSEVRKLPIALEYWEALRKNKATSSKGKYLTKRTEEINKSTKTLKPTNNTFIDLFISKAFPLLIKPIKNKNWSYTVLKSLLGTEHIVALAIKNKNLESLRNSTTYEKTFLEIDSLLIDENKVKSLNSSQETSQNIYLKSFTDYNFKVFSSAQQKKYILNKGYKLFSNEKSSKSGEDSFGRKEVERLLKQENPGSEAFKFLQLSVDFSFASVIKKNFIENILAGELNGFMHSGYRLGSTKSFRPASGGGSRDRKKDPELLGSINYLNLPSAGNRYASKFKKCITVPTDEWVWIGLDFTALEENVMANVSKDPVKVKVLKEGFDLHCKHAPSYFPRIEEILGKDDGSLQWNKTFKEATNTNKELAQLRQDSKPISFSLAYLAGLSGLFRSVGYTKDVFDKEIRFRDYTYTTDLEEAETSKGIAYLRPTQNATWYSVEEYKHLDTKFFDFFENAVLPAKNAHETYHNTLYSGLRDYRDNTILKQAKKYKNVHNGLGLYLNVTTRLSNGVKRTLNNAQYQSYSHLALIAAEKFRRVVYENGLQNDVKPTISIYDSLYTLVKRDVKTIEWVRDTINPIVRSQYLHDQPVPLEAELEISLDSWADFVKLDKINLGTYLK